MDKNRIVFLTGATGVVGSYLLMALLKNGNKVYVLARKDRNLSARERIFLTLQFWDKGLLNKIYDRLIIVEGDISAPDMGIASNSLIEEMTSEINLIFHSAALAEFRADLDTIRKINVLGTRRVLDFSLRLKNLLKFNHMSTVYVAGNYGKGSFKESSRPKELKFFNNYEQTKYESEELVWQYDEKGLNVSIFRPSMIVGDSITGKISVFKLVYEALYYFSKEIYQEFPMDLACAQNLINIDTVISALLILAERKESAIYHLISPNSICQQDFIDAIRQVFDFKLPKFVPLNEFSFESWTPVKKELAAPFLPYCNYKTEFLSDETQKILRLYNFAFPIFDRERLLRIFEYYKINRI